MITHTSTLQEIGITLPDNPAAAPIYIQAQEGQLAHVYGIGMKDVALPPGRGATFAVRPYWWPVAALRVMFGMPVYRWTVLSTGPSAE